MSNSFTITIESSSQNLFPIRLKPQEDELFSSWITRLALAHGLNGDMLANQIWTNKNLGNKKRDLDQLIDKKIIEEISKRTGVSTKEILNTSLFNVSSG